MYSYRAAWIARPSVCRLSSVCLSETFVHPTQAIEIFGNVSTPFNTLATCYSQVKFYGDRPRGTPPSGELNTRGVAKYNDFGFGPIERYISETVQDIGAKLVLITNRKSHMSFRFVSKSVTLDDLERRNSPKRSVISPNSVVFGTDYLRVVENTPILSAAEM